ncbi:glycine zipper 2TM domain-containing protein [Xanthomonas sacchari]|uniref:Glycine zipper 2TM domain-containing protein n=1 Tax=Xanthomonas sacchari TaxID=56458 RepID=A0A2P5Z613_9XANT|nr:glycine zipper 2TM domain-containing protein [Xanthomonas sacchari]MDV0438007.1 glycine zipper 2TM domain-containing protein [Xanthomonas sacchari]PPU83550.1 glycine zipper 2TM domain-containing protein [Xanthomonas sacchari]
MNTFKSALCLSVLAIATAAAPLAEAQRHYGPEDNGRRFSDGTRVHCKKVAVRKNSTDPDRIGGTLAGAAIGGLLGNQIGKGDGRKLATVGGAVAGGATGRYIQGQRQQANGNRVVETVCKRY